MITAAYVSLWLTTLFCFVHTRMEGKWPGRIGITTLVISFFLLTTGLIARSAEAGHWPLTNRYEVALCILWAMLAIYLLLLAGWREQRINPYILGVALLVGSYAITRPLSEKGVAPLLPVLRTIWLQIHVLTSVIGYGAFGVAAGLGLTRLRLPLYTEKGAGNEMQDGQVERAMDRVIALGFPWLSLGILTGGIWAQKAWGRYWGWDPKESWALVTWLWYLLILHLRSLRAWRGRRLAWLTVFGFILVIFTFIGVPWMVRLVRLESLHGF